MNTPDPAQSIQVLKGLAALLTLLLIVSNVMWYIVYSTATSPLARPTPTYTSTPSVSPTPAR